MKAFTKSLIHQFCIDEAQRVRATILPEIIKEMRKKGLILGISTQELDSLPVLLQKAFVNIAGNMFVFEQGPPVVAEAFLRNLLTRRCAIKTRDYFNGIEQSVNAVVDVPPLDRYKPDGSVAHFDDPEQLRESTAWTLSKAAELESKNGLSTKEIDQAISNYLNGTLVEEEIISNLDTEEDQVMTLNLSVRQMMILSLFLKKMDIHLMNQKIKKRVLIKKKLSGVLWNDQKECCSYTTTSKR